MAAVTRGSRAILALMERRPENRGQKLLGQVMRICMTVHPLCSGLAMTVQPLCSGLAMTVQPLWKVALEAILDDGDVLVERTVDNVSMLCVEVLRSEDLVWMDGSVVFIVKIKIH
jgi:hypothetical protein